MEKIINIITIISTIIGGCLLVVESRTTTAFVMGILMLVMAVFLMIGLRQPKVNKPLYTHPRETKGSTIHDDEWSENY